MLRSRTLPPMALLMLMNTLPMFWDTLVRSMARLTPNADAMVMYTVLRGAVCNAVHPCVPACPARSARCGGGCSREDAAELRASSGPHAWASGCSEGRPQPRA